MLVYTIWKDWIFEYFGTSDMFDIFMAVIGTIIFLPVDILFSPIELIAFIIYKIIERKR